MVLAQLTANALIAGSIVSLVAVGFSLIYTTNRFAHFAHGAVVAVGGYITAALASSLGIPFLLAALLGILCTGVVGVLIFDLLYRPLRNKGASTVILLIASIALMILIENLLLLIFGGQVTSFGVIETQQGLSILGAIVTPLQLSIVGISVAMLVLLFLFVRYSQYGRIMRAVADNPSLAAMTGIPTVAVQRWSFFIGSTLAGLAGVLIGLEQQLVPHMGTDLIIRAFTGAVIGGVSSLPGAVLGGYVLGAAENYGIWFLPSSYKEFIAFGLLLLFLIFRPTGIFGIRKGTRQ